MVVCFIINQLAAGSNLGGSVGFPLQRQALGWTSHAGAVQKNKVLLQQILEKDADVAIALSKLLPSQVQCDCLLSQNASLDGLHLLGSSSAPSWTYPLRAPLALR